MRISDCQAPFRELVPLLIEAIDSAVTRGGMQGLGARRIGGGRRRIGGDDLIVGSTGFLLLPGVAKERREISRPVGNFLCLRRRLRASTHFLYPPVRQVLAANSSSSVVNPNLAAQAYILVVLS